MEEDKNKTVDIFVVHFEESKQYYDKDKKDGDDFKVKYLVINLNNLDTVDNIGYQSIDNVSQVVKAKNGKVLIIDRYNHFFNPDLLALNIIKI